jgi:hypothetical protein
MSKPYANQKRCDKVFEQDKLSRDYKIGCSRMADRSIPHGVGHPGCLRIHNQPGFSDRRRRKKEKKKKGEKERR